MSIMVIDGTLNKLRLLSLIYHVLVLVKSARTLMMRREWRDKRTKRECDRPKLGIRIFRSLIYYIQIQICPSRCTLFFINKYFIILSNMTVNICFVCFEIYDTTDFSLEFVRLPLFFKGQFKLFYQGHDEIIYFCNKILFISKL